MYRNRLFTKVFFVSVFILALFAAPQVSNAENSCAAFISSDLSLSVPIVTYAGQAYWADFQYVPNTMDFAMTNAGLVVDASQFSTCEPATLSPSLQLQIPAVIFNGVSYWAVFKYDQGVNLTLTGAGAGTVSTFTALAGTMNTARAGHTATLLPNGKILVAGGAANDSSNVSFASAELYDPATDTWSTTGSMAAARAWHTAILLPNGKVLIAGGINNDNELSSAELYDPATGTWSATGSLITGRNGAAGMLLLPNGKILIAGGHGGGGPYYTLSSAELYNPASGGWSATGSMSTARRNHTMTLLPDGKVLVTGGTIKYTSNVFASAELYDPATGTWSATGSMTTPRLMHNATLLLNGKVLVAGGSSTVNFNSLTSAELYYPAMGVWTATGSMTTVGAGGAAALLPNGNVLVAGGWNGTNALSNAELYNPAIGTWSATGSMTTGRIDPDTILLPNGKVLIVGGIYDMNGDPLTSAELYNP